MRKEQNGLAWKEWRNSQGILCIELTGEGFLSDQETEKVRAEFPTDASYEILVEGDCNVYMPPEDSVFDMFSPPKSPGEDLADRLFLAFRKGAFTLEECQGAYRGLSGRSPSSAAWRLSKNRGVAGGKVDPTKIRRDGGTLIPVGDGTRAKYVSKDGIVSDTVEANVTMGGIAGYFPGTARNPYVRKTAYTRDHWETFQHSWPFFQKSASIFKEINPIRYAIQQGFVEKHSLGKNEWVIPHTPFSTITVNKNFQTACHQDAGDLKAGFENFSVLEAGPDDYKGGYTVFPQFRLAFDCRHGDWVGMDVAHYYHGNTPIEAAVEGREDFVRVSLVMYVREDLAGAGTQEQEEAKRLKWKEKWRNPVEQHAFRKEKHERESQKDEDFMSEFGG